MFFFTSKMYSQCGNMFFIEHQDEAKKLSYRINTNQFIKEILDKNNNARTDAGIDTFRIPIVFNVLFADSIADAKLFDASVYQEFVDSANFYLNLDIEKIKLFNRAEFYDIIDVPYIMLYIAKHDPSGNSTFGIRYKKWNVPNGSDFCSFPWITGLQKAKLEQYGGISAWNNKEYLNFWVGNFRQGGGCYSGQATYPTFPFLPGQPLNFSDGILLQDYLLKGNHRSIGYFSTIIHELGHYLGLLYIWGGLFSDDEHGCNIDDNIKDTPLQYEASYNCIDTINSCIETNNDKNDMCSNVMDYGDGITFTKEQVKVMHNTIMSIRKKLNIPKLNANLQVSNSNICKGDTVQLSWVETSEKSDFLYPSWDLNSRNLKHTFVINQDTTLHVYLSNAYDTIFKSIDINLSIPPTFTENFINTTVQASQPLSIYFENTTNISSTINYTFNNNVFSFIASENTDSFFIYFDNNCFEDSIFIQYKLQDIQTKINTHEIETISIFPNPANDYISISKNTILDSENISYEILNQLGQLVFSGIPVNNTIQIHNLDKGIYYLKIQNNKEYFYSKFIKN